MDFLLLCWGRRFFDTKTLSERRFQDYKYFLGVFVLKRRVFSRACR